MKPLFSKFKFLPLVLILFLVISLFPVPASSADSITIYVVPAITDTKILPTSTISATYQKNLISLTVSPGEYEPASFVIQAQQNISGLSLQPTDLTGTSGTIPSSALDISIVKRWYQGGSGNTIQGDLGIYGKFLTPELLLKDDSLVRVTGENWNQWNVSNSSGSNSLKVNGSYIDISGNMKSVTGESIISTSSRPISDSTSLQPFDIAAGYNKQFWLTLKTPENAIPGDYSGKIYLNSSATTIGEILINVKVLPIQLAKPYLTYSIYYRGVLDSSGSISSERKNQTQFLAEMTDMAQHGVKYPTLYPQGSLANISSALGLMSQADIDVSSLYYIGSPYGSDSTFKNTLQTYGVSNIYLYGVDEGTEAQNRPVINDYHNRGYKAFVAVNQSVASALADVLDVAIVSGTPNASLANLYHSYGHKIFSYANPQVIPEYPRLFRLNYGLLLWQNNYDGVMDYAYQDAHGDIWNDFDDTVLRDHVFAYPTLNGVIDTIQWEGFREGVDDIRYLTTLQNTIQTAKSQGKNTSAAENWLSTLKSSNLSNQDLDVIRAQMINYILSLKESR